MLKDNIVVTQYMEAYTDALESYDGVTIKERKALARQWADEMVPAGAEALAAWSRCGTNGRNRGQGRVPTTDIEKLGQLISGSMGRAINKLRNETGEVIKRRDEMPRRPAVKDARDIEVRDGATISELYRAWISNRSIIPADKALAHFLQCSHSLFTGLRTRAHDLGYEFARLPNDQGWRVVKRPEVKPVVNSVTTEVKPVAPPTVNGNGSVSVTELDPALVDQLLAALLKKLTAK